MPTTLKNEAAEAYRKAIDHHVGPEYDHAVEEVLHEIQEMNTGLSYESIELLADRVAAVATLAALAHVNKGGDAEGMRHVGADIDYLGGDHASDEVLKALEWMEHEDAILEILNSAANSWAVEITEAALEYSQ